MKQKNVANFFNEFSNYPTWVIYKTKPGWHFWVPPLGTPSKNPMNVYMHVETHTHNWDTRQWDSNKYCMISFSF